MSWCSMKFFSSSPFMVLQLWGKLFRLRTFRICKNRKRHKRARRGIWNSWKNIAFFHPKLFSCEREVPNDCKWPVFRQVVIRIRCKNCSELLKGLYPKTQKPKHYSPPPFISLFYATTTTANPYAKQLPAAEWVWVQWCELCMSFVAVAGPGCCRGKVGT